MSGVSALSTGRPSQHVSVASGGGARGIAWASVLARLTMLIFACVALACFGGRAAAQDGSTVEHAVPNASPQPAARTSEIGGSVGVSFLLDTSRAGRDSDTFGGLITSDALFGAGPIRWGGTLGIGIVTSDDDARTRMMAPFGLSMEWGVLGAEANAPWSLGLRLRAGGWAGAIQSDGLAVGAFGQGGAFFDASLGHGVGLGVHADAHWFSRAEGNVLLGLGLHLSWSPQTL